nr:hypothetical protein [Tanacetum cinerariifolium]
MYLAELMKKKKKTGGQNVASTSSGTYRSKEAKTHVSKKGASYFITFTDDYRGYGYVYLLKHKHEIFETFKLTPPYTPQHNGVSERRNRTLVYMVRSMMSLATLPLSFWDYALESAARTLNMVPTKKVDKTPYELWHGKVPNLSYLKESKRIVELEDEDILPSKNTSEHPIEEESLAPIVSQEEDVIPVRRSVRTHKAPDRLCLNVKIDPDRLCFNVEVEEHILRDLNEPANYKAALSNPEFEKWLVAMNAEMQSMYDNKGWRLVVLPPNAKVVKSKWIYKKKTDMDGKETFSPVADIRAIRILIAIATYYDYKIWQMDVKTAFLNGFLEEEIYMEQLEGFIDPNHPMKVYEAYADVPYASAVGSIMYAKQSYELIVIAMLDSKPIEMTRNLKLEAEYIAASEAAKEAVWIRKFIDELGVVSSNDYPIKMNCDNSAAIIMAKESGIPKGAKHFKRKYHYVCVCIETGEIDIVKVHTDDNLADPFKKALAGPKLTRHARSMGLHPASSFIHNIDQVYDSNRANSKVEDPAKDNYLHPPSKNDGVDSYALEVISDLASWF